MKEPFRQVLGFLLVVIISFSAYLTIVQLVSGLESDLIIGFNVSGLRGSGADCAFRVNDVLLVEANCSSVSSYCLQFFLNSSLVFERNETVSEPAFNVIVPVVPPVFNAGNAYLMVLNVFSYNDPIPGAYYSDSTSYAFGVTKTRTLLGFSAQYNESVGNLRMSANLTDADGFAIAGESVDFFMQFGGKHGVTDGWFPLGSAVTGEDGVAENGIAFCGYPGNYSLKACHAGNGDFGESEKCVEVSVLSDMAESMCGYGEVEGFCEQSMICSSDSLTMSVGDGTFYATVPRNIPVQYVTDTPLVGEGWGVYFYLDIVMLNRRFGFSDLKLVSCGPPYVYEGSFLWLSPRSMGYHTLIGIVNDAYHQPEQGLAEARAEINTVLCPSNLVVRFADAMFGDALPVTVSFSGPRLYEAKSSEYYSACTLAPQLSYAGLSYVLDEPVSSVSVSFYVNGSLSRVGVTDENGLVSLSLPLSSSDSCSVSVYANGSSRYYVDGNFNSGAVISRVSVHDGLSGVSNTFKLNCTMLNDAGQEGAVYVGTENSVETTALVAGLPVEDFPFSVFIGKDFTRQPSNRTAPYWTTVPSGSTFLRVTRVYDILSTSAINPATDINRDCSVDILDYFEVCRAYGSYPGHPSWDWRADINFDVVVDVLDQFQVSRDYGQGIVDESVSNYSDVKTCFKNSVGQQTVSWLDSWGCVAVPSDAVSLKLLYYGEGRTGPEETVGGVLEFCQYGFRQDCLTNNVGVGRVVWTPPQSGENYFLHVQVFSDFTVTARKQINETIIDAEISQVRFFNVVKRPVNFTIDLIGDARIQTINSNMYVYVREGESQGHPYSPLLVGGAYTCYPNYVAYVYFNTSCLPQDAWIVSARLNLYCYQAYGTHRPSYYEVHRVTSFWDRTINWENRSSYESGSSCDFMVSGVGLVEKWFCLDVSQDVRMWFNGSTNYGFALTVKTGTDSVIYLPAWYYDFNHLFLELTYVAPSPQVAVNAYSAGNEPVSDLPVAFHANGLLVGSNTTDSSGVTVLDWEPSTCIAYNFTVSSAETWMYLAGSATSIYDFRFPTNVIPVQGMALSVNADINFTYQFDFNCTSIFGLEGLLAKFTFNGTTNGGSSYVQSLNRAIPVNGHVLFSWPLPAGAYSLKASFAGSVNYMPCEVWVGVNASVFPLAILFSVSPEAFEPNSNIALKAKIVNALTNEVLSGSYSIQVEFLKNNSDGTFSSVGQASAYNGVASLSFQYPNDGKAYAFTARIVSISNEVPQSLGSNPIQLTVSQGTALTLKVSIDAGGAHVVGGWLKHGDAGVSSKQVKIKVNETEYLPPLTNASGFFGRSFDFKPIDNKPTTYQITAWFEGDTAVNATVWANMTDGTRYAACTTIQYGFKPSVNYASIIVQLQATEVTASSNMTNSQNSTDIPPPKSPEELQQEAEQSETLSIWHEFSWWYPWYRFHVELNMNGARIHVGVNPVMAALPGANMVETSNFANLIDSFDFRDLMPPSVSVQEWIDAAALDVLVAAATLLAVANCRFPPIMVLALATYIGGLIYLGNYGVNDLYNAGFKNAGRAFMAGLIIGLISTALAIVQMWAYLSGTGIVLASVISAIVGSLVGNLYDPAPIRNFIKSMTYALISAIIISAAVLALPEPIGNAFYCSFLVTTITAIVVSVNLINTM